MYINSAVIQQMAKKDKLLSEGYVPNKKTLIAVRHISDE